MQLRPHHIMCDSFLELGDLDRGEAFNRAMSAIKAVLQSDSEALIEVIEGVDLLCRACPDCNDERCESPHGNEDAVRKWDQRILQGLGIAYGEKRTARALRSLIAQKAPLAFCTTRCPWRTVCKVFEHARSGQR